MNASHVTSIHSIPRESKACTAFEASSPSMLKTAILVMIDNCHSAHHCLAIMVLSSVLLFCCS